MNKRILCFVALGSCLLSAASGAVPSSGGGQAVSLKTPARADLAQTVIRMLEEVAAKKVWPGFEPSTWPLALYDGEKTFLLWHPDPPAEFKPVPGRPGVLICPGRYPGVEAGSTCDIAGVRTATLIVTSGVNKRALIEETFHVFWLARHRVFRPDEMARYAYPLTDAENLAGLLAEGEALARALEAGAPEQAWRWVAAALEQRSGRRFRLDEESATFETDLEMLEGPANFTGDFAMGWTSAMTATDLRRQNYANATGKWKRGLEEIRWRFYYTGEAMGWLLERLLPGWKERLEAEHNLTMQRLLEAELARNGSTPSAFTAAEKAAFRADAEWAIADLARRRSDLRAELEARGGARLIVETAPEAEPLQLGRFATLNLFVLGNGQVVHAKFISLSDSNGSVELTNPDFAWGSYGGVIGLTESAGRRPLGDGTRRLTVFGIRGQPKIERKDGTVAIEAPGVRLKWKGAEVVTEGATIKVKVGSETGGTTSSHGDPENAGVRPIKWIARANLPLPHRNGKAVSSGEKIYFMGGYCPATEEDFESSNYEYDPQKDSWTAKAKIPVGRSNFALASLGRKIFVIGGDPLLPNNDLYLTDENRWEGLAPLSIPRQQIDCGIIGSKVYVVGGRIRDPNAPITPTVEIYDIAKNSWTLGHPMPEARHGVQVAVVEGKLYAIGGGHDQRQGGTVSSAFERYDPEANTWESLPDLPFPILVPGIAVVGENIFVLGGSTVENGSWTASEKVCFYDVRRKQWGMASALPKRIQFAGVAVIDDRIYVIGGCDKEFKEYDSVYEGIFVLPH